MRIRSIVVCVLFAASTSGAPAEGRNDEAAELLRQHREAMAKSIMFEPPPQPPPKREGDVTTNVADSGTNGDVIMTSPWPYSLAGVLLQAKSSWPYVVAKSGGTDYWSGFAVYNSADVEQFRVTSDGHVGIGTNGPRAKLHVFGNELLLNNMPPDGTTPSFTYLTINNRAASGGEYAWRFATSSSFGGWGLLPNALELLEYPGNSTMPCCFRRLVIKPSTTSNPYQTFVIDGAGNVGIGVWSPAAALHVAGDARFDGTVSGTYIKAHYQDVAEWVPAKVDLEPGTVVVLDTGNGVTASTRAYDTSVAGVVSAQPGIVLGEEGVSKEQVATTGRVRVKVDASRGSIAVGDLLVTSDKAGYAMRSAPLALGDALIHRPGTIVGKALEPLAHGEGEILVLLSLQ